MTQVVMNFPNDKIAIEFVEWFIKQTESAASKDMSESILTDYTYRINYNLADKSEPEEINQSPIRQPRVIADNASQIFVNAFRSLANDFISSSTI